MIEDKFVYFITKDAFFAALNAGQIQYESIVFVGEDRLIWNRGQFCGISQFNDGHCKGYFITTSILLKRYPRPEKGDWAIVKVKDIWIICFCKKTGVWTLPPTKYDGEDIDLGDAFITKQWLIEYLNTLDLSTVIKCKGYFDSYEELIEAYPNPQVGDWAIVNENGKWIVYKCFTKGVWESTGQEYKQDPIDLSTYVKKQVFDSTIGSINSTINEILKRYISWNGEDGIQFLPENPGDNPGEDPGPTPGGTGTPVNIDIDSELSLDSTNPVENKAITLALRSKLDASAMLSYAKLSDLEGYVPVELLALYATKTDLSDYVKMSDLNGFATTEQLETKQDKLVSGRTLKTINTEALLGSGNITVITPDNINQYTQDIDVTKLDLSDYAKKGEVQTTINNTIQPLLKAAESSKGYFDTLEDLIAAYPNPKRGDWAVVTDNGTWVICRCNTTGVWEQTTQEYKQDPIDLSGYVKNATLDGILSGININNGLLEDKIAAIRNAVNELIRKYISWYGESPAVIPGEGSGEGTSIGGDGMRHVFLEEEEYANLTGYSRDTIYFVYEPREGWALGDALPLILS